MGDRGQEAPGRSYERIYLVIEQIPSGKVATYGHIAAIVGGGVDARMVGWALAALPQGRNTPWQRVINARGAISARGREAEAVQQRRLLEAEGVVFDEAGQVDFGLYGWEGPDWEWIDANGYCHVPPLRSKSRKKLSLF
jgi:methylated-DNA-protein-cysteine methyltransferase-like protein